ncbi:MAG: glycoside hydrolase family 99-like domain-containing protein [Rhizobiaceae bacterium]
MRTIEVALTPCHEVVAVDSLPGHWEAKGIDPQFEIQIDGQPMHLRKGYCALEISNKENLKNIHNPILFYDSGSGLSSERSVQLSFQHVRADIYRAYFFLAENAIRLRFDPTDMHAVFHIRSAKFTNYMRSEWYVSIARLMMKQRRADGITLSHDVKRASWYVAEHGVRGLARKFRERIGNPKTSHNGPTRPDDTSTTFQQFSVASYDADPTGARLFSEYYRYNSAIAEGFRSPAYAPDRVNRVASERLDVKLIAYYLPQFHRFDENDLWWGKGFTEWTNVTKAVPRFAGHYQPKLPSDLGFYDLTNVDTMRQQAAMAKKFGLSGFCFHFYWFGGKRLMETPILNYLAAEDIDFDFSLCWANENWSRRWDGAEHEMLIGQKHSADDDIAFIEYVAKYFADKRYIRIDGKPVLTIYRPDILPDAKATVKRWRAAVEKLGFPGIYLVATNSFGFTDYRKYGFDALSEFPPHAVEAEAINSKVAKYDHRHGGGIFEYSSLINWQKTRTNFPEGIVFPGVMPAWDNVARRPLAGHVFHNSTPEAFREWLMLAIERVRKSNPENERVVIVNAWNEWAEGAYLEPDRLNGYAYLWATASAIEDSFGAGDHVAKVKRFVKSHNDKFMPAGKYAVAAHLYYQDTIDDLKDALAGKGAVDFYVTVPETADLEAVKNIAAVFPRSYILPVSNCGRDILPFVKILQTIKKHPYDWVCKIHSKKSVHLGEGNLWRRELFGLLFEGFDGTTAKQSHALLPKSTKIGMAGPTGSLRSLNDSWVIQNNKAGMDQILLKLHLQKLVKDFTVHSFFAGTMFWFRPAALEALSKAKFSDADFGVELGRVDGTLAHAMERVFGIISATSGHKLAEMANGKGVSVDISLAKRDRK